MARPKREAQKTPALEWVAAGLGALIAIVMLGSIGWQALAGRNDPVPLLSARVESVTVAGQERVATVVVTNASGRTAAAVQVEGENGDETSGASIDYVPGHGEAKAALIFADPARGPIAVRVTGYEHP